MSILGRVRTLHLWAGLGRVKKIGPMHVQLCDVVKTNERTHFDVNCDNWSAAQWHETFNLGVHVVKDQSHRKPKLDLEA